MTVQVQVPTQEEADLAKQWLTDHKPTPGSARTDPTETLMDSLKKKIEAAGPPKPGAKTTVQVGNGPKADLDKLIEGTEAREAIRQASRRRRGKSQAEDAISAHLEQAGFAKATTSGDWYRLKAAEALLPPLRKHHPHLESAYIIVLAGPLGTSEGCKQWGRARRLKKTERALLSAMGVERNPDYVIEVDDQTWAIFDSSQRFALLDHELLHMAGRERDDEGNFGEWKLRGHDLEIFVPEVQRHGLWRPGLKDLARAIQPYLPGL